MQNVECRLTNVDVFGIAQELLNSAFDILHSTHPKLRTGMAAQRDLKRNVLLRNAIDEFYPRDADTISKAESTDMAFMHFGSVQLVFRWLYAERHGLQANPANRQDTFLPSGAYSTGVSGPKKTMLLMDVSAAKCPGPPSAVISKSAMLSKSNKSLNDVWFVKSIHLSGPTWSMIF